MNINISLSNEWANVNPNFIYNRVDLYSPENAILLKISGWKSTEIIYIPVELLKHKAIVAVWGMVIPVKILHTIVKYIFKNYSSVYYCEIRRAIIPDYNGNTKCIKNDIYVPLPKTEEELDATLSSKGRYNIRREKRIVSDKFGECSLKEVKANSEEGVGLTRTFFKLKEETYGSHYNMSENEYLRKYHVSNIYYMMFENDIAAILMSCEQCDMVYLENLTYDPKYKNFSPGQIAYDIFLKELIHKKKKALFLLGGEYGYKQRYGSIERDVVELCINRKSLNALIYIFGKGTILKVYNAMPSFLKKQVIKKLRR